MSHTLNGRLTATRQLNGILGAVGSGGTNDYNALLNKPSINNVTLEGNKTAAELGIIIPTKTSDLLNNSGYITQNEVEIPTIINNISGLITSFNNGGDNIPLKKCIANIPVSTNGISEVNLYCAGRNIYPIDYSHASQTVGGITFSFNDDGSVEMTGTATTNTYPYAVTFRLPPGTYKKSSAVNDIGILVQYIASSTSWTLISAAPATEFTITNEISQYPIVARVRVPNNKVLDHYKYYPFIYVGSETDLSFEKYIGQVNTISLDETLTQGGSLDVLTGVLTRTDTTTKQLTGVNVTSLPMKNNIYNDCGITTIEYFNNKANEFYYLIQAAT